jgi:hypothetical protein
VLLLLLLLLLFFDHQALERLGRLEEGNVSEAFSQMRAHSAQHTCPAAAAAAAAACSCPSINRL